MPTQELVVITKDTQKIVLKAICESPTLTAEELTIFLKSSGKKVSEEEVIQVLHGIAPNKNWHRATKEDIQKEVLEYVWTLEAQVLFLFPTKQKETTLAEFNQIRLQNKQSKVQKDVIRHLQSLLTVENKNLSKFRKFEKELSFQSDLDANTQAIWAIRIVLANVNIDSIYGVQELPTLLSDQFKEKFSILSEKVGKTIQRISEKFFEKYFSKNISVNKLKELIVNYQSIYRIYKKGVNSELATQSELLDQNKMVQNVTEQLKEIQEILSESEDKSGLLSKLFASKITGKEGIITKIDAVINLLSQVNDLNTKTNKATSEKVLLVQKLQSDYENIILVKNQLENDLYNLNEKFSKFEENNTNLEKELHNKTESLEKAHEKIAMLQQKVDAIPEIETKINVLREELNIAKDIALRLYRRVTKLKDDLFKQNIDKPKIHKINNGQSNNPINIYKNHEPIQTIVTTESSTTV